MARAQIVTLVNPTDEEFVDYYGGDDYIVPAHGELPVNDYIAIHFCGDGTPADRQRAEDRRGSGGKKSVGVTVYIKEMKAEEPKVASKKAKEE